MKKRKSNLSRRTRKAEANRAKVKRQVNSNQSQSSATNSESKRIVWQIHLEDSTQKSSETIDYNQLKSQQIPSAMVSGDHNKESNSQRANKRSKKETTNQPKKRDVLINQKITIDLHSDTRQMMIIV